MSAVTDALDRFTAGEVTIEEVAERFRSLTWPADRPPPEDYDEMMRRTEQDPQEDPEGSFSEVALASVRGQITLEEYGILVEAVAPNGGVQQT